jgi:hypothetical protein
VLRDVGEGFAVDDHAVSLAEGSVIRGMSKNGASRPCCPLGPQPPRVTRMTPGFRKRARSLAAPG